MVRVRCEPCGRVFVSRAVASNAGDVCPTRLGVVRDLQFAQAADSSLFHRFFAASTSMVGCTSAASLAVPRRAIIDVATSV